MPIPHLHSPNNWRQNKSDSDPSKSEHNLKHFLWQTSLRVFLPAIAVLAILSGLTVLIAVAWYSKELPDPNRIIDRSIAQSTKIYDRTGERLLYEIHGSEKRTIVPINQLPKYVINSTIALEDHDFYNHSGFSLWGMLRGVVWRGITGQSIQGGSTLTQQLVKNAILSGERTISRKLKELVLSYQIEKTYNKQEILQLYFNEIPYGSTAYGIEAAATTYFDKPAKDLTMAEAATLASLPKAPSRLSPFGSHKEELLARKNYCLDQMVKLNYITQSEADQAKKQTLIFRNRPNQIEAPHFVFYVKELLGEKLGDTLVEQGGLKIITTLDYDLQKKAESIISEQAIKNAQNFNANNAALVSIDVPTGQVLAMVGSKDYYDDKINGQVNVATSNRQPGSSIKPFVYLTAFQRGLVPESVVYDVKTVFPSTIKDYSPENYNGKEYGPVSLRQALAGSLNTPAVKTLYLAGLDNVLNNARAFGYTTLNDKDRFGLSFVLGGAEVKLIEHVNAYAGLARDGQYLPSVAVLKVTDKDGKTLDEAQENKPQQVIDQKFVNMLTSIMTDNAARSFIFGSTNYLTLPDRPVAAKTGTTNSFRDAWTVGFTPQIATGVWVGNNDNTAMKKGADGSQVAAPIWRNFMQEAHRDKTVMEFPISTYDIPNKPMLSGDYANVSLKIDSSTGQLASASTPEYLITEKNFRQYHSILYYVDRADLLGPIPETKDPMYESWEKSVQEWVSKNNLLSDSLPTPGNDQTNSFDLNITNPGPSQTISTDAFGLQWQSSKQNEISILDVIIDGQKITSLTNNNQTVSLPELLPNGAHVLTLVAKTNSSRATTNQNFNLDRSNSVNLSWINPRQSTSINNSDFPFDLTFYCSRPDLLNNITFQIKNNQTNQAKNLGVINSPTNTNSFNWVSSPKGDYSIIPIMNDRAGRNFKGPSINISVE